MWIFDYIYTFFQKIFSPREKSSKVVIVGLDNAGKTTMLCAIKTGNFQQQEKTKSFNREEIRIAGVNINAFDLGGHDLVRQAWSDYYLNCQGIVFVIDASNQSRFNEAKEELDSIMNDESIKNVPILILANKVDVAGAASYIDIIKAFNLKDLYNNDQITISNDERPVNLVMTSIRQHFGYLSGFKWLSHFI